MRSRNILALLLAAGLTAGTLAVRAEEKEEGDEVKVKFDDCPAAVKATITKEAEGAKVDSVDKETDDGKTIYEADAVINGQNYEIKVYEDGKLLSKKIDNEDEEKKGGEKEEDEKHEHK
jgi:hypothetical protein